MIKIENVSIHGWEEAIRGMRNPMNSWDKSDSYWTYIEDPDTQETAPYQFFVGDADKKLMKSLAKGGSVEAKYRRMITVYLDITAPLYWWKEFDTYKVGTVANSCSTMHKIQDKEFEPKDFSVEHLSIDPVNITWEHQDYDNTAYDAFYDVLAILNAYRIRYLDSKDKNYWWQMIQLLPSSYNQRRTIMLNYEVLAGMYRSRKFHRLDEWRNFCKWIETLPHSDLITGED